MKTYQSLERIKEQRQRLSQPPSDNYQNRDNEQSDLDTRPNGNTHCQVEFSFAGDHNRSGVLCGVGNDWNDDEGNPFLVHGRVLDEAINTVNEIFGCEVGDNRDNSQKKEGRGSIHEGKFDVLRGGSTRVSFDGSGFLYVLRGDGEDVCRDQMRSNRFTDSLKA